MFHPTYVLVNGMRVRHSTARWPCQERDTQQRALQRDQYNQGVEAMLYLPTRRMHRGRYQGAASAMPLMLGNRRGRSLSTRCTIRLHLNVGDALLAIGCLDQAYGNPTYERERMVCGARTSSL
jgi:hypothetical protein